MIMLAYLHVVTILCKVITDVLSARDRLLLLYIFRRKVKVLKEVVAKKLCPGFTLMKDCIYLWSSFTGGRGGACSSLVLGSGQGRDHQV